MFEPYFWLNINVVFKSSEWIYIRVQKLLLQKITNLSKLIYFFIYFLIKNILFVKIVKLTGFKKERLFFLQVFSFFLNEWYMDR